MYSSQFIPGQKGQQFRLVNPATDEEIGFVHEALAEDVDVAVESAQAAFIRWSELSAHERAAPMFKLVQLIQRDAEELAKLDALCMGKSVINRRSFTGAKLGMTGRWDC